MKAGLAASQVGGGMVAAVEQEGSLVLGFWPEIHDVGEEGEAWIWLHEFEEYGVGDTLVEARADLVETVRDYAERYMADPVYLKSPNRGGQLPHVLLAMAADAAGQLEAVLMGEATLACR